jgi:hypothetical protein
MGTGNTVRPEPVEGLPFSVPEVFEKGVGFDRLSPNGFDPDREGV